MEAIMTLRAQIYGLLDPTSHAPTARKVRALGMLLVLIGISSVSVGTVRDLAPAVRTIASTITGVVAAIFFFEYLVRLWIAPNDSDFHSAATETRSRLHWAASSEGVIDLLAVIPAVAVLSGGARLGADSASVFVLLWVLKLAIHAPGVRMIARVFHNERSALAAALVVFVIILFSAATLTHWLEGEVQTEHFGSIPSSLWWSMVTLTTTGYGDVVPQTTLGRVIGGFVMLCGISVLAMLAGILATGFAEEVRRREFVRIWNLVARVPFFAEFGAITISDIVGRLRVRHYPPGATVIRKGAAGDSMFFLVSGEVEVRVSAEPIVLRDGQFFGELALLDRKPRSADVVTMTPCTMLVLNVADFYQLVGQQPQLISAIEKEAERRRTSDRERAPKEAVVPSP